MNKKNNNNYSIYTVGSLIIGLILLIFIGYLISNFVSKITTKLIYDDTFVQFIIK